ncbi:MAG: hypothetical protein LIP12_01740 [Clostridiales bacterium]|nr:hypothetical protein [Clostridiales bacterium]
MRTVKVRRCDDYTIRLGAAGENNATQIVFDLSWLGDTSAGTVTLLHQRSTDTAPYPVALDGNVWTVSSVDTAIAGKGLCEVQYIEDDTVIKSHVWETSVAASLGDPVDADEPEANWLAALYAKVQSMIDDAVDDDTVAAAVAAYMADNPVDEDTIADAVVAYLEANPVTIETTDKVEEDNTLPVTSGGVYTVVGNIEVLLNAL